MGDKLIKGQVKDIPVRDLLNKIIIFSDGQLNSPLSSIVNGRAYRDWKNESFNSDKFKNGVSKGPDDLFRIYPAGDTSGHFSYNYDPLPFLNKGFQIVSLNF